MARNTVLPGIDEVYAAEERGGAVKYQEVLLDAIATHGALADAFGRLRVSNPTTLFDTKMIHGNNEPLFWDEQLISGTMATTTPTHNKPYIDFTSTDVTAGRRVRQTRRRFNYQPGKSQLILMTGVLELASGVTTGCKRKLGIFDDDNGAFFMSDAGTVKIVTRTKDSGSAVDTEVSQTSWNIDTMDGDDDVANPSGLNIDWSKAQIFVIDYQWLSVGRVRFGLEHDGRIWYVHEVDQANSATIPWASTPNLPLRYEIETTTSSGVCSMRCICCSVQSEGGTEDIGKVLRASTAGTHVDCNTEDTVYALIGIRLGATHPHTAVKLLAAEVQAHTASEKLEWMLLFNPTVDGAFTYSAITNSSIEYATGATANTVSALGTQIGGGYIESGGGGGAGGSSGKAIDNAITLGSLIDGTADEIVLAVRPIGGTSNADVEGALLWREL